MILHKICQEPGFYKEGEFGIRVENLLLIQDLQDGFWGFENLSLCPYDKNLMDKNVLIGEEIE